MGVSSECGVVRIMGVASECQWVWPVRVNGCGQ